MARFLFACLAFALVMAVIKMVVVAILIAGLIFRTKITVGLLLIGGLLTLARQYPIVGVPLIIIVVVLAVRQAVADKSPDAQTGEVPKLTE